MRQPTHLYAHCTATPPSFDVTLDDLRQWHVVENGWDDVGYHWLIERDGTLVQGRDADTDGAHAYGHNHNTLAVALAGGVDEQGRPDANFTFAQYRTLYNLALYLKKRYPEIIMSGHRDVDSGKACPSFDFPAFWDGG